MFKQVEYYPQTSLESDLIKGLGCECLSGFQLEVADLKIEVLNYGASLRQFSQAGVQLALGYENPYGYLADHTDYLGAVLSPFAGRLDHRPDQLAKYLPGPWEPGPILHGGRGGGAGQFWSLETHTDRSFSLLYELEHGADGFAGRRLFRLVFDLDEAGELAVRMEVESDRASLVNLSYHPYFNLSKYPDIHLHNLKLFLDQVILPGPELLPNWDCCYDLVGTALDFKSAASYKQKLQKCLKLGRSSRNDRLEPKTCQDLAKELAIEQSIRSVAGLDHYFTGDGSLTGQEGVRCLARLYAPDTGIQLELLSDAPGLVLYSGQFCGRDSQPGLTRDLVGNRQNGPYAGLAMEAQLPPNGPSRSEYLQLYLVEPGQTWQRRIIYRVNPPEDLRHGPETADFEIFDDPMDYN